MTVEGPATGAEPVNGQQPRLTVQAMSAQSSGQVAPPPTVAAYPAAQTVAALAPPVAKPVTHAVPGVLPQQAPVRLAPAVSTPAVGTPTVPGVAGVAAIPAAMAAVRTDTGEPDDFSVPELLARMIHVRASDLHLTANAKPRVRVRGELHPLEDQPELKSAGLQRVLFSLMTQSQREGFEANLELDFAYSVPGLARFRVNVFRQRGSVGAVFRAIPSEIMKLEDLGVPPSVSLFAGLARGMVLVTGPTGSGKSTTLASIIDLANRTRADHIMTVEDPIEFLHKHKKSLINQREIGGDTKTFASALKHVLRQDPDIILVGEMRDLETIGVALTAAETGHLVFATLHTQDAAQTIDRVIDVFPPEQQAQVRVQLAGAIQGVVCQTLCKTADGKGRVVATEVLTATPAIRNLIREGKTHQIYSAMQAGAQHGMHTLDQHLAELVRTHAVTYEHALEKCHHVEDFNRLLGRV